MIPSVGLVGCGRWGRFILRDLKALGARVTVADASAAARDAAAKSAADAVVSDVDELPGSLDGYVVAAPTSIHAAIVTALLSRGRPIFVEKPFTNDPIAARRLADEAGDRVFVMEKWRYHPGVEALRELAASGELGPLESIRTFRLGWGHQHADVDAIWTLLPHDLSIVDEILGRLPEPVFAQAERRNGEFTGLTGALAGPPDVVVEVSARRLSRLRLVSVGFADGVAALEDRLADHIAIGRDAGGDDCVEKRAISTEPPLLRELRAFLEHLQGGPPPKSTADGGARVVAAIGRLRELAKAE